MLPGPPPPEGPVLQSMKKNGSLTRTRIYLEGFIILPGSGPEEGRLQKEQVVTQPQIVRNLWVKV